MDYSRYMGERKIDFEYTHNLEKNILTDNLFIDTLIINIQWEWRHIQSSTKIHENLVSISNS